MTILKLPLLLLLALSASCASLRTVSVTDMPAKRNNVVAAHAEKFIFLGLSFDNDFVDKLNEDLASQCSNGKVSGILTKHETYFYFLAHKIKVKATGYCQSRSNAGKRAKRKA